MEPTEPAAPETTSFSPALSSPIFLSPCYRQKRPNVHKMSCEKEMRPTKYAVKPGEVANDTVSMNI